MINWEKELEAHMRRTVPVFAKNGDYTDLANEISNVFSNAASDFIETHPNISLREFQTCAVMAIWDAVLMERLKSR